MVQDAYLRYQRALADGTEIESTRAYLSAVVTGSPSIASAPRGRGARCVPWASGCPSRS